MTAFCKLVIDSWVFSRCWHQIIQYEHIPYTGIKKKVVTFKINRNTADEFHSRYKCSTEICISLLSGCHLLYKQPILSWHGLDILLIFIKKRLFRTRAVQTRSWLTDDHKQSLVVAAAAEVVGIFLSAKGAAADVCRSILSEKSAADAVIAAAVYATDWTAAGATAAAVAAGHACSITRCSRYFRFKTPPDCSMGRVVPLTYMWSTKSMQK